MATEVGTDIDLEFIFALDEGGDDNIHQQCPSGQSHVLCGAKDVDNVAPEWMEVNCESCVMMIKQIIAGVWTRCEDCKEYFRAVI